MIVCIAEKPDVARNIAEILGARNKRDGYIEGNGYQVTWTFGHLCTLKEPGDYTQMWQRWSLGSLPMIPPRFGIKLIDKKHIEKQFAIVEKLMQAADCIINCGDAGQEGELIQRWVIQKTQARCPVKRLWVSSMTEEAIREGFATLKDQSEYQSLYEAGLARAIGDWLLGMNATRLYTLKYGQNRQVLSIGRVQTPTLALIVKRQMEIENFVPKQYWVLKTIYRDTPFNVIVKKSEEELMQEIEKQRERASKKGADFNTDEAYRAAEAANIGIEPISNNEQGLELIEKIKDEPFVITSVSKKEGKEYPPSLYDLQALQSECDKKYGIPIETTLQTVQSLYEKRYTTYPRVDTTFLSDDIYPKCPAILKGLRDYTALTTPLEGKPLPKSKKIFNNSEVTDHHAIIPTGVYPQGLTDIEKKVYNLIALRFIAAFYPECKVCTTTVQGEAADIPFKTSERSVIEQGWRVVFADENSDEKEKKEIPTFVKGESGPHTPELQEKWTTPPKPYTEGTLVLAMQTAGKTVEDEELRNAMKKNGIGRPATRADIINTLFKRNYIKKVKRNVVATETGIELINIIRNELLKSAELTGQWEKKLRDIEKKEYEAKTFIEEMKQMLNKIINEVLSDNSTMDNLSKKD